MAPAQRVAERAGHQLPGGEPEQARGQRQLHQGRAAAEVAGEGGERGQVQVYGQRAERREAADDKDELQAPISCLAGHVSPVAGART